MIKPIKKLFVQITPIKFINSGKVPQNDIVPANKINQVLEKVPPEDEFLQITIGEIEDYNEKDKKQKKKSEG